MKPYYNHDGITLYLGDCREVTDWLTADVLVTDPPYGIRWEQKTGAFKTSGKQTQARDRLAVVGDNDTSARDWVLTAWDWKPWIIFGSWRAPRPKMTAHRLIWHKAGMSPGPLNAAFMSQDEEIYVSPGDWRRSSPPQRTVITTTEARSVEVARIGHPTPKPVSLMELLVSRCQSGVIADPFAGSGATLLAARNLGRAATGVEIDERFCEIAATRLSQGVLDFGDAS